ncbi:MAG: hypothetical protein ACXWDO_08160, partial [Bacteroidia bacterium]
CNLPGTNALQAGKAVNNYASLDSVTYLISIADIKNFVDSDCNRVIYTDAAGNEQKVSKYTIIITYNAATANKTNISSNFEEVIGDKINKSVKKKLSAISSGDKIMLALMQRSGKNGEVMQANTINIYIVTK